jgi:hypothetical protein
LGDVPVGIYELLGVSINNSGTESVSVYPSLDGGAHYETFAVQPINATTGQPVAQPEMDDGVYWIDIRPFTHLRFVKSGAVSNVTLRTTFYG